MMGDDVDVDMSPPGSPRRRRTCPPTVNAYSVAPPLSSSSRRTPYPPPALALSPPTPQALGRSLTRVSPQPKGALAQDDHEPDTGPCHEPDCVRGCAQYRLMLLLEDERTTSSRLRRDLSDYQARLEMAQRDPAQLVVDLSESQSRADAAERLVSQLRRDLAEAERRAERVERHSDRVAKDFEWYAQKLEAERNQWAHEKGQFLANHERVEVENRELREKLGLPRQEPRSTRGIVMTNPNDPDGWVRVGQKEKVEVVGRRFKSSAEADAHDAEMARRSRPGRTIPNPAVTTPPAAVGVPQSPTTTSTSQTTSPASSPTISDGTSTSSTARPSPSASIPPPS
ncbi:uncharacterized protein CcaverHIS019_0508340 [Cutaneotrichosporon cavernicola]|uniref:Uncharacterized protein n=1 Tax=Cutaneotrichosporon cavernicola TaxID=279322 RepID=A0AA48L789_9TREE|nr:uncharacterized protein CcaverHIS019_0508340 [Cutaneotrichosporon cavernicola]BEI93206.1 hypothetical protein CcaverHIS019_0508340 [Cutaneotrichosporon cavernicola]BEJ00983.1 hypothetical protein CcaverHIS631_0508400 [Cutaneotrichosporon cavernicola]BEJ08749.1 hypothetical protein CcaverHIS641_0508430 [Cutaneotrichosporon cavernicola]